MDAIAKYFTGAELRCKCCGENKMQPETLKRLDELRDLYGKPIKLSSAYRCESHNNEIGATQTHATGRAVDILCRGVDALHIIQIALSLGFTGFGIKQHGDDRFVHLDDLSPKDAPRPALWSYK
jgi:uncharacterized protein YcbK (DUF882 family)